MTQIFPRSKLAAILPKHVGGDALLTETDTVHQILGFCRNNFCPIASMAPILTFLESQQRDLLQTFATPSLTYWSQVSAKCTNMSRYKF